MPMTFEAGGSVPRDLDEWLASSPENPNLGTLRLVHELERTPRRKSLAIVRILLGRTHLTPEVMEVHRRLLNCGRWTVRHDRIKPYRHRCRHPLCPSCQPRLAHAEAKRVLALLELISGGLDLEFLSWVTVNGERLLLGQDFGPAVGRTKTVLRNIQKRYLRGSAWAMGVHIVVQEGGRTGMEHLHGLVWHPGISRAHVRKTLKAHVRGHKAVKVEPIRGKNLNRHIVWGCGSYMADLDIRMSGYGRRTPEVLAALLHSYETVRSRGRMGIRFEIGFKGRGRQLKANSPDRADHNSDRLYSDN